MLDGEHRVLNLHLGELNGQHGYILDSLGKFEMGGVYDVALTDDFQTRGVLIDIRYDRKGSGSPAAPSKVKLIFAVADPIQAISLPLSKKLQLRATDRLSDNLFDDWDDIIPTASREDRYIITGNLLQGFDRLGRRAEVITYTDDKGSIRNGILLPKSLKKVEEKFTHQAVDAGEAYKYLVKDPYKKTLNSTNGLLSIDYGPDGLEVNVPKAKVSGAKYYLNDNIRDLVLHNDFTSKGNRMWASVETGDIEPFLKALQEETGSEEGQRS